MQQPNILPMLIPLIKPKKLIDRIKEAYPNPKTLSNLNQSVGSLCYTQEDYCILQAAHMFFGGDGGDERYWTVLDREGADLSPDKAWTNSHRVTSLNDRGRFDESWELLGKCLPEY